MTTGLPTQRHTVTRISPICCLWNTTGILSIESGSCSFPTYSAPYADLYLLDSHSEIILVVRHSFSFVSRDVCQHQDHIPLDKPDGLRACCHFFASGKGDSQAVKCCLQGFLEGAARKAPRDRCEGPRTYSRAEDGAWSRTLRADGQAHLFQPQGD